MRLSARALAVLLLAGCGAPPKVEVQPQPAFDPDAMTAAVLAEYDRNKNGAIDGSELDPCPALKGALAGIDTNRDGKLSADELKTRFEAYRAANTGSVAAPVTVTLDGAPLASAVVQFVPEACMGGAVSEASCKTRDDGTAATFAVNGKEFVGLQPGLYKVKITRSDGGGKELPAKYNAQTTLGAEVFGGRGSKPLSFALTSR